MDQIRFCPIFFLLIILNVKCCKTNSTSYCTWAEPLNVSECVLLLFRKKMKSKNYEIFLEFIYYFFSRCHRHPLIFQKLSYKDTFHHPVNSWCIKSGSALHFLLIDYTWSQQLRTRTLRLLLFRNQSCCDHVDLWCPSVTHRSNLITTMTPTWYLTD